MTALRCKMLFNRDGSLRLEPLDGELDSFEHGGIVHLDGEEAPAPLSPEEEAAAIKLAKEEKEHAAKLAKVEQDKARAEKRKSK